MILEKHLKMDEALSSDDLVRITKEKGGVRMLRGMGLLKFRKDGESETDLGNTCAKKRRRCRTRTKGKRLVKQSPSDLSLHAGSDLIVEWDIMSARVIRPDLRCTNGYVHVIDTVLMRNTDVHITSGARSSVAFGGAALAAVVAAVYGRSLANV